MSDFSFDVDGKKAHGTIEKIGSTHRGSAKCPQCRQEFKVGYSLGDMKKESAVKASLKSNVVRHYERAHKGGPAQVKKRRPGW